MLERTSRFVLEVLPYLLTAVIAAFVLPQLLYSQAQATKAVVVTPTNVPGAVNVVVRVGTNVPK